MWLPEEKTSIGIFERSAKSSLVSPNPPAAFSMLTTVKSIFRLSISGRRASCRARLPGEPTTSPTKSKFTSVLCPLVLGPWSTTDYGPGTTDLPGVLDRPGFSNDRDLDLARVLQLRLDLLGD